MALLGLCLELSFSYAAEFESQNLSRRLLSHFVGSREPSVAKLSEKFVLFPDACANPVRAKLFVCVSPATSERLHDRPRLFWMLAFWRFTHMRSGGANVMGRASRASLSVFPLPGLVCFVQKTSSNIAMGTTAIVSLAETSLPHRLVCFAHLDQDRSTYACALSLNEQ